MFTSYPRNRNLFQLNLSRLPPARSNLCCPHYWLFPKHVWNILMGEIFMSHTFDSRRSYRRSVVSVFVLFALAALLVAPVCFFKLAGRVGRAAAARPQTDQAQAEADLVR